MLRSLDESDREGVLAYLQREPAYNVFTIGDIENYGFDAEFQEVWGDVNSGGDYRAVVLRYYSNHLVYSADTDFDRDAVEQLLSDVQMNVTVELVRAVMAVRDLLSLQPGSIVELDRAAGAAVDVLVNGTLVARGEVVVIDDELGVRVTELIER